MKIKSILIFAFAIISTSVSYSQQNNPTDIPDYEIRVKFKNLKDTVCYLGVNFGNNKYFKDTARVNSKGVAVFKGSKPIEAGVYLIITPRKDFFEFILNEKKISLETDTSDFIKNMKVLESNENIVFFNYLNFMRDKHIERSNLVEEKKKKTGNDSLLDLKIAKIDTAVKLYRDNIKNRYNNLFFAKILKAMDEPQAREKYKNENDTIYGKYLYNWYQLHFFDNIDFSDPRMLRTPIYEAKVDKYMEDLTLKHPDSLKFAAERVIDKSMANREMFKFTLIKLFNKYAQSQYMGQDAIFVYLAERYYLSGLADWTDSTTLNKIYTEVVKKRSNLIGNIAPNLKMRDSNDHVISLYDCNKLYTVLVFWDPDCSHCRVVMPQLVDWYNKHSKDSFDVYAVGVLSDRKKWTSYINEHKFKWINVWDPDNLTNFRLLYDVYSTPIIYVIDKNKKIQAKKIPLEKLDEIIQILNKESK